MANRLEVFVTDEAIDVFPGEVFTITFQSTDLVNFTGERAPFSKTFTVPSTLRNRRIFENAQVFNSETTKPYRQLPARVVQNGTEIVNNGVCYIESSTDDLFEITIYGGNLSAAKQLQSLKIRELDLSQFDFEYTPTNAAALSNNASGLVWGVTGYEDQSLDVGRNYDIRTNFFAVYIRTLIELAFESLGFTFENTGVLQTPDINKLVMPLSNAPVVNALFQARRAFEAEVSVLTQFTAGQEVVFDTVTDGNAQDEYNATSGVYSSNQVFNFTAIYSLVGQTVGGEAVLQVRTQANANGAIYEEISLDGVFEEEVSVSGLYSTDVTSGLVLRVISGTVDIDAGSRVFFACNDEAATWNNKGSLISIARSLPDLTAWDLFKSIRQFYGTVTDVASSGKISVITFDQLLRQEYTDWSDKLDLAKDINLSYRSGALAKRNNFKFTESEDFIELDPDSFILINDENLEPEQDIVNSVFAASPTTIVNNLLTSKVSMIDLEQVNSGVAVSASDAPWLTGTTFVTINGNLNYKYGDFIVFDDVPNTIALVVSTALLPTEVELLKLTGTGTTINNHNYEVFRQSVNETEPRIMQVRDVTTLINYWNGLDSVDNLTDIKVLNFFAPEFNIDLTFDNLIEQNYVNIRKAYQQQKIVTASLLLNEADIRNLSFVTPKYIERLGGIFYLNKINKYRVDESSECELVALFRGFGDNVILDWTNVSYAVFNSLDNNILRAFDLTGAVAKSNTFAVQQGQIWKLVYELRYFPTPGEAFVAITNTNDNYFALSTVIFGVVISGNVSGNYDPLTGVYTHSGDPATGNFSAVMTVQDNTGGGGTTTELIHDDGAINIIDSNTQANNTLDSFTLSGAINLVAGDTVYIRISPGSSADVISGSGLSVEEFGASTNTGEVRAFMRRESNSTSVSNQIILKEGKNEALLRVKDTEGFAHLAVRQAVDIAADYTATITLQRQE